MFFFSIYPFILGMPPASLHLRFIHKILQGNAAKFGLPCNKLPTQKLAIEANKKLKRKQRLISSSDDEEQPQDLTKVLKTTKQQKRNNKTKQQKQQ